MRCAYPRALASLGILVPEQLGELAFGGDIKEASNKEEYMGVCK